MGIDFGTHGTGMAYQIPGTEAVYCIRSWSDTVDVNAMDENTMIKTSTSVLLNKNKEFVSFGTNAHVKYRLLRTKTMSEKSKIDHLFFERFKMALYGQFEAALALFRHDVSTKNELSSYGP